MVEGEVQISLELLRKIWKDYITPFVLVERGSNVKVNGLKMGGVCYTDDINGLKFSNWKDQLPFPDFVDQWLEAHKDAD